LTWEVCLCSIGQTFRGSYERPPGRAPRRVESKELYFVRFVLFCADVVNDFLDRNCPYVAAAIAFYTLFSLFPLSLAVISVVGFLLGPQAEETQLAREIARVIPVSSSYISETIRGIVSARTITGVTSVLGLLWAATAMFGAIRKGINNAWGVKRTRPFLKERLMDFGLALGAGLLMLLFIFLTPAMGLIREILALVAPEVSSAVVGLVSFLVSPLISFLIFLILYRYLPNTRVTFRDVWPGALAASLAFDGTKWGFVTYIKTFPVYNVVYGSVGAILALLTWVYLSAIILLFGALVTSRYARYMSSRSQEERQGLRRLWLGLARVKLRVVESTETG